MHNSSNFIIPVSAGDKEVMLQDVNSRRTFTINPWDVTFISVSVSAILVRTVGSETQLIITFISSGDALLALPKLQEAITLLKNQTQTGLDQDTINYINNLFINGSTYHHIQSSPSDTWTFTHNLNKRTSVTIENNNGEVIIGLIKYVDNNTVTINFNQLVDGHAWI